jgi:nucleoside-diphosphate-sugar epimerase
VTENKMPVGADGQAPSVPKAVFVTGANGFIGRALLQRYRDLGCDARGMDFQPDPARNVVAGDLMRPETWAMHAKGCDLFIHTASVVSLSAEWSQYRLISVDGTRIALDAAIAGGAKRFVHFSSIAALGNDYAVGATERSSVVIGPDYRYGVGKGASEHVVLAAHAAGEIDCTIIRPGDVYGPGSRAWLLEPLHMARRGRLLLPDGGRGIFTPVYVDDLLDGVMLAAGLAVGSGQIFILWGNEPVSCKNFFAYHWRWAGRKNFPPSLPLHMLLWLTWGVRTINKLLRIQDETDPDTILMFSRPGGYGTEKARQLLGYFPKVNLTEGMRRSEIWLRSIGENINSKS